jgi:hypothetical protein
MQQKRQSGQDGAAAAGRAASPSSVPQASLERLVVRAPEAEPFL